LSAWEKVREGEITVANGVSELISWIPRLKQNIKTLILAPTFTEYEKSINSAFGLVHLKFALEEDLFQHSFEIEEWGDWDFNLVFISNPNNPTGNLYDRKKLEKWIEFYLKRSPETLFVCDESFLPFVNGGRNCSLNSFAVKRPGVIVLHSLTKLFSVPGLRLGTAVAHQKTIQKIESLLPTWRVNSLAQKFGESLLEYADFVEDSIQNIDLNRNELVQKIMDLRGVKVFPAFANFILIRLPQNISAKLLTEFLAKKGLFIRLCNDFKGLEKDRFIRLAVRKKEENEILIEGFKEYLSYAG